MALQVAVMGLPNSGKSYSRTFIEKGEECFVISPSAKMSYLTTSKGEHVNKMSLTNSKGQKLTDQRKIAAYLKEVCIGGKDPMKPEGNYLMLPELNYVEHVLKYISDHMPWIKNVFIADFTHYISYILTTNEFRSRKSGGQAFERFWDLAADALTNVILSINHLRDDLLVFTEYHVQYNEDDEVYDIYVPAGNMLRDKFKPKSYYDIVLHSYVIPYEEDSNEEERFKFIVVRKNKYDGRSANLFKGEQEDGMIPNNMEHVIERIRKVYGI
jgi:hypothetical protein